MEKKQNKPEHLLCEHNSNPLGIDITRPRFSWLNSFQGRGQIQSAYQILVFGKQSRTKSTAADMWDSGRVVSDNSINVVYEAKPLESKRTYYWKVRVWDGKGEISPYSDLAAFEMGLLEESEWQGEWIGLCGGRSGEALFFRKDFLFKESVSQARAYISGLGYYELHINGTKIGDHVLDPGWTEYTKRILYVTYDVTRFLRHGENTVGVVLGNGWYGSPQFILQIEIKFTDGQSETVVSDCTWMVAGGPITRNSIYDGEFYDARLEKVGWDSPGFKEVPDPKGLVTIGPDWMLARRFESPGGVMKSQMLEPIKVIETISPVRITNPKPDVYIFDMGQNMVGWIRFNVNGPEGTMVVFKYAELLGDDGTLSRENLWAARSTDTYILKGEGREIYEPRFTYHGFRYVQVEGFPGIPVEHNLEGKVVHSAVEPVGSFTCSNELLNKIHENVRWSISGNLHSVPSDCPQRSSRLGWTGDATVGAETAIYNFDMLRFYTKWLDDIKDAQDKKTGCIPDTIPYRWGKRGSFEPAWGSVYVILPWYLYLYYGDKRILEQHFNGMRQWVEFLETKADDHIIFHSRYGDWCPPISECYPAENSEPPPDSVDAFTRFGAFPANTPGALTSTGYYYYSAWIMAKIATILGKPEEAKKYLKLANHIGKAFNNRFLNENNNQYGSGSQCCNAFPLYLGLVPEKNKKAVLENLLKDITQTAKGHLTTGILGTQFLMEVLTGNGLSEIAYALATQTSYPSWGYMISSGATTIWERWESMTGREMNSHNHYMFTSVGAWFYKALAGININSAFPGWRRIIIKPCILDDLEWVKASVKTIRGNVLSSWRKHESALLLNITVPTGSQAEVCIPELKFENTKIIESGKLVWRNRSYLEGGAGIAGANKKDGYISFEVGSGTYFFEVSGTPISKKR